MLRSYVHGRSLVLSLVALSFAWGCSSDSETPNAGPSPFAGNPPSDVPNGAAGSGGSPTTVDDGQGVPVGDPAMAGNSEGVGPIQGIDDGEEPGAANGGEEPAGEEPAGEEPVGEEPPVEPVPVADVFVEDSGLDCAVGNLPNAIAGNPLLPNPFLRLDGTPVTTQAEWRCRRKEIRAMAEQYVFGTKPPKPESVTGSVTNTELTVNVSNQGNNATFTSDIELPTTGTAPFPAVFNVGTVDRDTFLSQGVAIISFGINDVGLENGGSAAARQNKSGAFYTLYGNQSPSGLLAAWAWGVSRAIDVIEASDGSVIDKDALAVMGCSRSGKAAFAIGALDERIALSIPFESGTAGVPIFRGIAQAEIGDNNQPSQPLGTGPNGAFGQQGWFGDAFANFMNAANTTPIDTHEIVGMYAPRGLLILDNPFIGELSPRAAHAAALGGVEVYRALGAEENLSYLSTTNNGQHCLIRPEYQEPLRQAIQKHLFKNESAAAGAIQVNAQLGTADRQEWIDWETPTLQ
jgi:hypothetical protein